MSTALRFEGESPPKAALRGNIIGPAGNPPATSTRAVERNRFGSIALGGLPIETVRRVLGMHQQVLFQGRPHWLYFVGSFTVAIMFALLALVALATPETHKLIWFWLACGGLVGGRALLKIYGAGYLVTTESLTQRSGLISRNTSQVDIQDVRNIQVKQGIAERIFGLGSVLVSTAGQAGMEVEFWGIKGPEMLADRIRRAKTSSTGSAQAA